MITTPSRRQSAIRMIPKSIVLFGLILCVTFSGCSPGYRARKIPVTFRRAPVVNDLDRKTLLIGPFIQKSPGFQAGTDIKQIIQRKCEQHEVFNSITYSKEMIDWDDEIKFKEKVDEYKNTDWDAAYADYEADYLVTGVVRYTSRDRSGYETDFVTNRYGYTYKKRVYKDRVTYSFELAILLVDLKSGEIVSEKIFRENDEATGGADGISVFFEIAGKKIDECIDSIQGPKIRTKRYLLYN